MPITPIEFRSALSRFASGVTVVTTKDAQGKFYGLTVSAFCAVSLDPPLILACVERKAGSHHAFDESGVFAVNILSSDQSEISEHFASVFDDKFKDIEFETGLFGIPVLPEALVTLECRLKYPADGGDHSIFIGEVENVIIRNGAPLVYFRGDYREISD